MLLSALALAAALQAAPEISLKGYLSGPGVSDRAQSVGELTMPLPKIARMKAANEARARGFKSPSFKPRSPRQPPRSALGFVRNPQMTTCNSHGLTEAGHPEALKVQPLSKMPKAHGERAVVRLVDGCPVAVMIAQR